MAAVWFYRLLLRAYPSSLRLTYGDEMALAVADRWRDQPKIAARLKLIRDILVDFVQSLPRAWRIERGRTPRPARRGGAGLSSDVRQAARGLGHAPWFTLGAIVTLALGIGASTAIFSLARATLLHPLDIASPDRVVQLSWSWSHPDMREIERRVDVFSGVAAWASFDAGLDRDGRTTRLGAAAVNGRYFDTLGLTPLAGRLIHDQDDQPGAAPVTVLTEQLWRHTFGADLRVIGATLRLGPGTPVTVIGVVPSTFHGLSLSTGPELYVPMRTLPQVARGFLARPRMLERSDVVFINITGRLRDDVTIGLAEQRAAAIYRELHPGSTDGSPDERVTLTPVTATALGLDSTAGLARFVYVLVGATMVTLLLACATVANLLLVRGERRQRELAIRAALGAGRARTARLLLAESLLLGIGGALGGAAVAQGGLALLARFDLPGRIPIDHLNLGTDWRLLAASIALGLATSVIFGAAPVWQSRRVCLTDALRSGDRGATRQPLRATLVAVQVALAVLLLAGSLAFARAVRHAIGLDFGFDISRTAIVTIDATLGGYTKDRVTVLQSNVLAALATRPDIEAASWSAMRPLRGRMQWDIGFVDGPKTPVSIETNVVSAGYFDTLRIPTRAGRVFSRSDEAGGAMVAVINEAAAKKYLAGRDPVGSQLDLHADDKDPLFARVIGVVGDTHHAVDDTPSPMVYTLAAQHADMFDFGGQFLLVRGTRDGGLAAREAVAALASIDPHLPITATETMTDHLATSLEPQRLGLTLFSLFAALAVVLTALGLYALIAYAVAHRTREIGIRMALGARPGEVVALVARQGVVPVFVGLVAGAITFRLSGWAMAKLVFALPLFDGWPFLVLTLAVGLVAVLSTIVPARRALAVDPVDALRRD